MSNTSSQDLLEPGVLQRKASHPATSVWVNASAGSGKTTVLTNRVTRLLLSGVKPERILCLTFTRAAAAEMANRVTAQLSKWATCSENELREAIDKLQGHAPEPGQLIEARRLFARVLACAGGMRIRTIHAFCQELLRRFPIEAGLPPHFALIEEEEANALQVEVQRDLLQLASSDSESPLGKALKVLVSDLGEKGFLSAMRGILNERSRVMIELAEAGGIGPLLEAVWAQLGLKPEDNYADLCKSSVGKDALPRADLLRAAAALAKGQKKASALSQHIVAFLNLSEEDRAAGFDAYSQEFFKADGELYKTYTDKATRAALPEAEDLLLKEALRLQAIVERINLIRLAENTAAVLTFGVELIHRYGKRKADQAALDYSDLIIRADELLRRPGIAPWVLYKLDGGLDHILVDEAQDTSRSQWRIVQALADEFFAGSGARGDLTRTLFVVGDEKQSIFSFQNADPQAFKDMRDYFEKRILAAEQSYQEVPLRISFRSAPAILKAVDAIFSEEAVRAGVSAEKVVHSAFHKAKTGRVEVWPLQPATQKDEGDMQWLLPEGYEIEHDPQAELAQNIADKIKGWLDHHEILEGEGRPVTAGDIMILLRRRGRFADLMVRALKQRDVPVTGVDRMRLVQQMPVMDLLAVIQFVLLPEDDLNTAVVLKSPLLNISEDQLMRLAIDRPGTLWHNLADLAKTEKSFQEAYAYLEYWLNAADFTTPFALLASLLNRPCPGSKISGRCALWSRLGPDALDPLDELLNAAQIYSQRHSPSLQAFLQWLRATEASIKRELDRGMDQVRIMTVHASKGLEAPIVFLPDTASVPRTQDLPKFLWDEAGAPLYVARKPGKGHARRLWDKARGRQMEEYRRLLYVALTRASNRLYVGGWETNRTEPDLHESWHYLAVGALQPHHEASSVLPGLEPLVVLSDPLLEKAEAEITEKEKSEGTSGLPGWAYQSALSEERLAPALAPSRLALAPPMATPDRAFARGRIIHRLLQSLPDIADQERDVVAARFLASPQHRLSQEEQDEVRKEVLDLLRTPDYASLFGPESRAEVPLMGLVGRQKISGQIDRLCIGEKTIWIVDYKTNRPPPSDATDVPLAYRQQLAEYRSILQVLYPQRVIRCFLLWTYTPKLMEIKEALLLNT